MSIQKYYENTYHPISNVQRMKDNAWESCEFVNVMKDSAWETVWPDGIMVTNDRNLKSYVLGRLTISDDGKEFKWIKIMDPTISGTNSYFYYTMGYRTFEYTLNYDFGVNPDITISFGSESSLKYATLYETGNEPNYKYGNPVNIKFDATNENNDGQLSYATDEDGYECEHRYRMGTFRSVSIADGIQTLQYESYDSYINLPVTKIKIKLQLTNDAENAVIGRHQVIIRNLKVNDMDIRFDPNDNFDTMPWYTGS